MTLTWNFHQFMFAVFNMYILAKGDGMEAKTIKFQMMLEPSLAAALDEWSWSNRVRSRAEAIRQLVRRELNEQQCEQQKADAEFLRP